MKIFISTDMEGVSGVVSWNEMESTTAGFWTGTLDRELNWLVEELRNSELNPMIEEIVICDSHARGENLKYGSIEDSRVSWIRGYPRPWYMMEGLDSSFDLVMLIGYHARIGSWHGGMDHSYSGSSIYNIRLNGREVGETEINSYYAGWKGVPVALVSGDDILEKQLSGFIDVPFVRTKEGIGRFSAKVYHPEVVRQNYTGGVKQLVKKLPAISPLKPEKQTTLEIDLFTTAIADAVSIVPDLERVSGRTVRYVSQDYGNILKMILTVAMIGGRFANYK
ncbi:MAG TPA: peptidase M55 [Mesotoga infera]|uniref:Peptidase M55 n=1 Tax=Mesotoga infera TaxID=1236046 RepID=A0A7C1CUM1_9BACT|nr:peptidase M55 [Mesotoga infera]